MRPNAVAYVRALILCITQLPRSRKNSHPPGALRASCPRFFLHHRCVCLCVWYSRAAWCRNRSFHIKICREPIVVRACLKHAHHDHQKHRVIIINTAHRQPTACETNCACVCARARGSIHNFWLRSFNGTRTCTHTMRLCVCRHRVVFCPFFVVLCCVSLFCRRRFLR